MMDSGNPLPYVSPELANANLILAALLLIAVMLLVASGFVVYFAIRLVVWGVGELRCWYWAHWIDRRNMMR